MAARRTDDELLSVVSAFVLRARRVAAHSLCADDQQLEFLANGAWIARRQDGKESLQRRFPAEQDLESLAARVRPLTLENDPVHYGRVLNALSEYLHRHDGRRDDIDWCRSLKADWRSLDVRDGTQGYYISMAQAGAEHEAKQLSDKELALAWFYGDLVHADQEQIDQASDFQLHERFAAAAVRVAQIAVLARDTLAFIQALIEAGVLPLDTEVFAVPVNVESRNEQMTALYVGEPGAAIPAHGEQPSGEWSSTLPGTEDGEWEMTIPWGHDRD